MVDYRAERESDIDRDPREFDLQRRIPAVSGSARVSTPRPGEREAGIATVQPGRRAGDHRLPAVAGIPDLRAYPRDRGAAHRQSEQRAPVLRLAHRVG